jgi:phosphoribosylanthranilate isomerase
LFQLNKISHKDNSVKEETEALGDLETYAGSIASSSERNIDPEQFLKQVRNVSTAIGVHRNKSENYILQFSGEDLSFIKPAALVPIMTGSDLKKP